MNYSDAILELFKPKAMKFREVEARLVLAGYDPTTYDVQRSIHKLIDEGKLKQDNRFRYMLNLESLK